MARPLPIAKWQIERFIGRSQNATLRHSFGDFNAPIPNATIPQSPITQ
jgi:hypothetical protein